MFELITTFYKEKDERRKNELIQAFVHNFSNTSIRRIYVLCESGEEFLAHLSSKIVVIHQDSRPKFADLIKFSNSLTRNTYKIIANSDIYFDNTLEVARKINNNQVYCLTRWDYINENNLKFYANFKSQDAWIFKGELPEDIGEYFMGLPGCDNRFAYELKSKGYKLLNPSFSIQAIHLHLTNLRNYNSIKDRVLGNYYYPLPYAFQQIKDNHLKRVFLLIRRKYFTSLMKRNLQGVDVSSIRAILSSFMVLYYKFRLKINE